MVLGKSSMGSSGGGYVAKMGAARKVRGRATVHDTCPCMARDCAAPPSPSLQGNYRTVCSTFPLTMFKAKFPSPLEDSIE